MTLDRDRLAAVLRWYTDADATHPGGDTWADLLAAAEEAVRLRDAVDRVTALCDEYEAATADYRAGYEAEHPGNRAWADVPVPAVRAALTDALGEADAAEGEAEWDASYWTQALHRAARIAEGKP